MVCLPGDVLVSSRSAVGHLRCGWPTPSNRHSKSHTRRGCPTLPRSVRKGGSQADRGEIFPHPAILETAESSAKPSIPNEEPAASLPRDPSIPVDAAAIRPTASLDKHEGLEFVSHA